jgi:hypothetical protein
MIDFDFIEIGTSDFNTLIEKADDNTVGLSIEPMKMYLDKLPNKSKVKKINCAISFDNTEGTNKIFYISEENIAKFKLPYWIKGCNSLGKYHWQHIERNLQHIVSIVEIPQIPLAKILVDNNVGKINFLKIDVEGGDCYILQSLMPYLLNKSIEYWPTKIQFETNRSELEPLILETIDMYEKIGYISTREKSDTILVLNKG